ncbi:unnamed protein product [Euphydryas editha]|uniref:Uncharacterized protein n=1 Tax=Euphydryas editha TaxID=104508 RepID=A0AAU9U3M5_EUPED|nr:unnamed protein product [Euphydryas editha]
MLLLPILHLYLLMLGITPISIPALFEHLVNLLQEKPEVLEQNDITVFTEDSNHNNEVSYHRHENDNVNGKRYVDKNTFNGEMNPILYLTADEVMEQVLLMEQRLENYNRNKN